MLSVREPILKPVAIADLRPTQMTVGSREAKENRARNEALAGDDLGSGLHTLIRRSVLAAEERSK
jgi:hypothetical protein